MEGRRVQCCWKHCVEDELLFVSDGLEAAPVTRYHDEIAATALGQVWGKTALNPTITNTSGQFPEGSIVVKVALTSALAKDWSAMVGASLWPLYVTPPNGPSSAPPQVINTRSQVQRAVALG